MHVVRNTPLNPKKRNNGLRKPVTTVKTTDTVFSAVTAVSAANNS